MYHKLKYMDIYIEYVFLDNLIIDYLLLFYTNKILAIKGAKKWIILLGAFVGACGSVILPLLPVVPFVALVLKFALSCVLVLFLGKNKTFREFITRLLMFYMLTFILGGLSYAILGAIGASTINGLMAYSAAVPLGVILLAIFVYIRLIEFVARRIYKKVNELPFIREIILIISNKQLKLTALLDSGNGLMDKRTGLPVVIITLTSLMRVYNLIDIQKAIETGKSDKLKNVRFINFSTVAGTSKKMMIFDADEMIVHSGEKQVRTKNFVLGLSMHEFKSKENYEVLLNPAMI